MKFSFILDTSHKMNITYYNKIKKNNWWFWDKNKKYYLVCTDDLDSLMSCLLILMYRPNWKIGAFFDYRDGLYKKIDTEFAMNQKNTIWVDCSSIKQGDKCISNHLTSIDGEVHNSNDINLNSIDNNYRDKSYFSKYNLSTFLLLVSLFEHEITTKEGRALSLGFDSSYKAFYQPLHFADKGVQKRYLVDIMKLGKIYDVQTQLDKSVFKNMSNVLNLHSKVYVENEGIRCKNKNKVELENICEYLDIDINLSCLDGIYAMIEKSTCTNMNISEIRDIDLQNTYITSFAITSNNNVSFSYKVD